MEERPEHKESLWWLIVAPTIWIVHLLACYITVAVYCATVVDRADDLGPTRLAIAGYTVVALAGVAWVARFSFRRHRFGTATVPHDFDTQADRHRFLGFAGFLLAMMSAIGILFVALPAFFLETCR